MFGHYIHNIYGLTETTSPCLAVPLHGAAPVDEASGALTAHCRKRLAAYKYPRQVEIIAELPKTVTGKVLRRELRARARRETG